MVLTEFNEKSGILHSKFEGIVSLRDVVEYIRATKNNTSYPRDLKILTDSRGAIMNFNIDDLNVIVLENTQSIKNYNSITDAIVLDGVKETALSLLYKELSKLKNYKFNVFSTEAAALNWLENN
jgi:glutamyl-tRNA reductase